MALRCGNRRRQEGHGISMTEGRRADEALASRRPVPQWGHIGLGPGFVDEDSRAGSMLIRCLSRCLRRWATSDRSCSLATIALVPPGTEDTGTPTKHGGSASRVRARGTNHGIDTVSNPAGHAGTANSSSCSVTTLNWRTEWAPKAVTIATSAASRPRAIRTLPIRGRLWRASKLYHLPPI